MAGLEALVEVTQVLLDVLVTDRSGNVVTGLGKDDFIVEEAGEPVDVTGVSLYTTRYGADGEPAVEGEVPASRYFFFFDDATREGFIHRQRSAAREAGRWVVDEMLPSDWVAVVSYDVKLKIHEDFTQNRDTILAGL